METVTRIRSAAFAAVFVATSLALAGCSPSGSIFGQSPPKACGDLQDSFTKQLASPEAIASEKDEGITDVHYVAQSSTEFGVPEVGGGLLDGACLFKLSYTAKGKKATFGNAFIPGSADDFASTKANLKKGGFKEQTDSGAFTDKSKRSVSLSFLKTYDEYVKQGGADASSTFKLSKELFDPGLIVLSVIF
jgi:hypothetical protein